MPRFNWKISSVKISSIKIFIAAFVIFNLNLRPIPSGDTTPAALLPFAVALDHSLTFDRFEPYLNIQYGGPVYFFHRHNGHLYSSYPIFPALLLLPLYAPLLLMRHLGQWPMDQLILFARLYEKVAASLVAASAVAMFFLLARRLTTEGKALVLTITFGFATETWAISSQALWQHGMSQLLIVLSLYCLVREDRPWGLHGAGLFAALSIAMRPTNVLFLLISAAVARRWKLLASYAIYGVLIGSLVASYNFAIFQDLRGGYIQSFNGAFPDGFAGLLFSPGRGLFFYSPVLLLVFLTRSSSLPRRVWLIAVLFPIAHILLYSKWPMWWGGHCFGPRLLTDITPCLVLLLIPALAMPRTFGALLALSIGVQFLGTFSYPKGLWDQTPVSIDSSPERLWQLTDNPITSALRNGLNLPRVQIIGLLLRGEWQKASSELPPAR
jgi:hypothetical protein